MKITYSLIFIVLFFLSCKKNNIEDFTTEDVLKGKLKEMIFSDYSTDQVNIPIELFYNDEERLLSIDFKNKKLFEWLSKPSDSLVFRYHLVDEETGDVTLMDFNVIKDAAGVILSIIGISNENYEGGDTLFYFNIILRG